MDARQLEFEEASFDFIIEKATIDSLLVPKKKKKNIII